MLKPDINDYLNKTEFNSAEWISWKETESSFGVRWNMVYNLTENHKLKGKTRDEIKILLGRPTNESKKEMSYYLGMTGHIINTGSLTLKFEKERVVEIKIWQG
ncbi:hypothetical protein [uncultured Polaribacter sp.]|uniref:hypothetical protein n=1 Tax=uncultured Polaribacter sp. TaxID=174711 RepID=UPI0026134E54|nr:hypothetical protein [uncultured Polaribacter sp.]